MTVLKSIRISKETLAKLEKVAEEEKRTVSNLINKILSDFVDKK